QIEEYWTAFDFVEGLSVVRLGRDPATTKWVLLDRTGAVIVPKSLNTEFIMCSNFYSGLAVAWLERIGKMGYCDRSWNLVIQPQFEDADTFSEGLAAVRMGGKYGYIDTTGTMVIEPQFERVGSFSEGLAMVKRSQTDPGGYIDKTGKVVIEL